MKMSSKKVMQSYVENTLVLYDVYDVTSTYLEGRTCPLAKLGAPGDGPREAKYFFARAFFSPWKTSPFFILVIRTHQRIFGLLSKTKDQPHEVIAAAPQSPRMYESAVLSSRI